MRILHIIPNLAKGGAERLVIDIVQELAQQNGVEVRLVLLENIIDYEVCNISSLITVIPAYVRLSVFKQSVLHISELQNFIDLFAPDVIHTHLFRAELVSRSCIYPKAKWFSHCHDNMRQIKKLSFKTFFNRSLLTNYYERAYLKKAYATNGGNTFIAISTDTLNYFKTNLPSFPIHLICNAINYTKFYVNKEHKNQSQLLRLINVGSFVDKKNQGFLLDVANILRKKQISFELNFLGNGPNFMTVKQKSERLNLSQNVFFHGNVDNVVEFLSKADIYIHSATYEPLGLVLLEAMAAGLPVVCLDGKGNRDIIKEAKNGFMLNQLDPTLFADKIIILWENKKMYSQISEYAQSYASNFDIKNYVEKLIECYEKK
jgi:glycosyltransferase involved in cell wall biosynthesis